MNTLNRLFLALPILVVLLIPAQASAVDTADEDVSSMIADFGGDRDC